jgi:hypothetical protein
MLVHGCLRAWGDDDVKHADLGVVDHDVVILGTDLYGVLRETSRTRKTDSHRDERQTSHANLLTDGVSIAGDRDEAG